MASSDDYPAATHEALRAIAHNHDVTVLVVAAHPDDETIAAGGRLWSWPRACVVHLTNGAPRDRCFAGTAGLEQSEAYARLRAHELDRALAMVGLPESRRIRLGRVDQEASLDLVSLTHELTDAIHRFQPELIVTHPYEGGHPDHDAAAFAVQLACQLVGLRGAHVPTRLEAPYYHRSEHGLRSGEFLDAPTPEIELLLDDRQALMRRAMFDCFGSQREVLAPFSRDRERYRLAPTYDFREPPHPGPLHYETLGWAMNGTQWRTLARAALERLTTDTDQETACAGLRAREIANPP